MHVEDLDSRRFCSILILRKTSDSPGGIFATQEAAAFTGPGEARGQSDGPSEGHDEGGRAARCKGRREDKRELTWFSTHLFELSLCIALSGIAFFKGV